MNDVPHNDDSSDDIDDLYRRAAAQDPSRPSPRVRQAVFQHAAQRAADRTLQRPSPPQKAKRFFPPRRAAILGTLAAAVLAGLVIAPQFLLTPPQPTTLKQPVEIARIQPSAPQSPRSVPQSPRAESVQPSALATSPQPPSAASSTPPPQVALNDSVAQERSKAAAKNRTARDREPPLNRSEPAPAAAPKLADAPARESAPAPAPARAPVVASVTAAAPLPPPASAPALASASAPVSAPPAAAPASPQPSAGATTMVNALSADVVGGYVPRDETYIFNEAPDSPLIGAAVRRAAEQGDIAKLQFLLDRGADINARDADNRSPLMLAVTHSRTKVVELLLAHGADANAADRSGTTPLQAAVSTHQTAIAATLRAAGAH